MSGAIEQAAARGIFIGAICAAPSLLQKAGLLDGRKFTCYPGCENPRLGGSFTGEPVEISDNIVTSRGAGTALLFGRALTEVLMGAAAAQKVYCDIKAV